MRIADGKSEQMNVRVIAKYNTKGCKTINPIPEQTMKPMTEDNDRRQWQKYSDNNANILSTLPTVAFYNPQFVFIF